MKLVNETRFQTGWNMGFRPDGREVVVVVAKGTYELRPSDPRGVQLADEQEPLIESDKFGANPAFDAPVCENDFALFKPMCDVLVDARAYAPHAQPCERVHVGLRVASCVKSFAVVGRRIWLRTQRSTHATNPIPFLVQPISYDMAYGGTDTDPHNPANARSYLTNPAGTGFRVFPDNIDQTPLPTTEELGNPVMSLTANYRPMALGPIGRHWEPRFRLAGTYDRKWQEEKLPFLPDDFSYFYFQATAPDQQIPYPTGGEPIELLNLSKDGRIHSAIPREGVYVTFVTKAGDVAPTAANLDTIWIDPEKSRLVMTWRCTRALDRNLFELREMVVEQSTSYSRGRVRARLKGKTYYPGLRALIEARRRLPR